MTEMYDFSGKVALVTGASRGIGKAIALELARNGALVVGVATNISRLEETVNEISAFGGKAEAVAADVSDFAQAEDVVNGVVEKHGRIDILVNNAGITRDRLLLRMKEEDWDDVLKINLKGVFNFTKAAIKPMMKQRYGRIINISSVIGLIGNIGQANYAASKAGIIGFTKSVAKELGSRGITVNAIAPGYIETDMTGQLSDEIKESFLKLVPLGRMGKVEDVSAAACFLASDAASYITGHVLTVDGGLTMW